MHRRSAVLKGAAALAALLTIGAGRASAQQAPSPDAPTQPTADYYNRNYHNSPPSMRKFVDGLPGLGLPGCANDVACNANNLHNYIPIAGKVTPPPGVPNDADYYEITAEQYTQKMHSDLPATKLRGYHDSTPAGASSQHYLGGFIIATKGTPVRVKFTNKLPAGNLFLPVDLTLMGAGRGPLFANGTPCDPTTQSCELYPQSRTMLHLHGGDTPWISDGTPHQWITSQNDTATPYKRGVSQRNVPDMDGGVEPDGVGTYYYPNNQSARLEWYHDHAYALTRLNVYAGLVTGYLLTDATEGKLIDGGTIGAATVPSRTLPGAAAGNPYRYGIPLVLQDKTFVDSATINTQDPTWGNTAPAPYVRLNLPTTSGALWFPHVYVPNQDPSVLAGARDVGRWDYGPWFWPPYSGLVHGELRNDPNHVGVAVPGTPNPSIVPEAFMDTPVVNGTPYPTLTVKAQPYRFRILNGSNDRGWNLSMFYAASKVTGAVCRATPGVPATDCTEVKMIDAVPHTATSVPYKACSATVTANCWCDTSGATRYEPTGCYLESYPTDGRDGGVPDPATSGPHLVQIGTEGGFLPKSVDHPNQPLNFNYNRRDIVVLNISDKNLFLGPAERADFLVDFTGVPAGSTLILYNDGGTPTPAFDTRYDYYTDDPDQTSTGGAPTTVAGYGPNTRTVMQFVIGNPSGDLANVTGSTVSTTNLNDALAAAYKDSQPPPIIPQTAYASALGTGYTVDTYVRIQDNNVTFTPVGGSPTTLPLQPKAIQELFTVDYGRMNATFGVELPYTNINTQTTIPLGYVDPPTEVIRAGQTQVWKITHNGVDTHAIHFHLFNVQLINRVGWDGAIRPPEDNEIGWKETVRMNPLEDVVVALQPKRPVTPFTTAQSIRPLDPTSALNRDSGQFTNIDPQTGNPTTTTNQVMNFGFEYVWHCHLLGHEENDMMRPMVILPSGAKVLGSADFNADGKSDILFRNVNTRQLYAWLMNGSALTSAAPLPPSPYATGSTALNGDAGWSVAGIGDLDGNGTADIVWHNDITGELYVWLMSGTTITSQASITTVDPTWSVIGVADFNGDGKADILWRNSASGQVYLWFMNGATMTSLASVATIPAVWEVTQVADFNGDGKADVLWRNTTTGEVYVWMMNGASMTSASSLGTVPLAWNVIAAADFNADNKADVLWRNATTGEVYVWLMNGASFLSAGSLGTVPAVWQVVQVADYNADLKADILWRNSTTGELFMWFMNGSTFSSGASLGAVGTDWQFLQ